MELGYRGIFGGLGRGVLFVVLLCGGMAFGAGGSVDLRVMSFNLKYASEGGEHGWGGRRGIVRNAILSEKPDLIGTQEGVYGQLKDMDEDLPEYDWIGLGRAGGSRGEFMAIFYRRDRFEAVAFDHFWLSDTPEVVGSRTWGHDNHRMVTWVRFREKGSGVEFYHWNTHFDHRVQVAREKSADLIMSRIRSVKPVRPVLVTGDFNAPQGGVVHGKMLSRVGDGVVLRDGWEAARKREGGQVSTIHGWRGLSDSERRIDWVLMSGEFVCRRAKVVTYEEGGAFPSDHFPVVCDVRLTVGD